MVMRFASARYEQVASQINTDLTQIPGDIRLNTTKYSRISHKMGRYFLKSAAPRQDLHLHW
jgi:hypothetical protein